MLNFFSFFGQTKILQRYCAYVLLIAFSGTMGIALFLQYYVGLLPCKLCFMERVPYYVSAPLLVGALVLSFTDDSLFWIRGLFLLVSIFMLYNAGLSLYHVAVEWKWLAGPSECSGIGNSNAEIMTNIWDNLNRIRPTSCSEAAFSIAGLSLAGWNGLLSLGYAMIAVFAGCYKHK